MHNCAVVMNLGNLAVTTYWDYDFNSLSVVGEELWGGSDLGLYQLDHGDTDAGTDILAKFRSLLTDFGDDHLKRVRYVVLGLEASGNMSLKVICDEQTYNTYTVSTDLVSLVQHGVRQPTDSTLFGRYWSVEISNVSGADFSIDRIILGLIVTARKFALRHRHAKGEIIFSEGTIAGTVV